MSKKPNQKLKLIKLLQILMHETDDEHGLTLEEITDRLSEAGIDAERKSLYDDFSVLDSLGFTVERTRSRPPRYMLISRIFELAELKLLVDAVESSKFITAKQSRDVIKKLQIFAGAYHARELSRGVYIEDRIKTANSDSIYSIDTIHNAINDKRMLSFKYFEYNSDKEKVYRHGGKPYTVSPFSLIWGNEKYYLVALDHDEGIVKNFRVDKMTRVKLLEDKALEAADKKRFNPADYALKIFDMYGGEEELVTLECKEHLAGVVIDRFGIDHTFIKTNFGFKFSVRVMVSPTFLAWVFEFGDSMRILSPESVRSAYSAKLREIAKNYE